MTIEFRCTNCDKLLRTPPGTEGKQAKCPDCGALMTIPAASAFSPPPREPDFRPSEPESHSPETRPREPELRPREPDFRPAPGTAVPRDSGNPFQSPSAMSMQPEYGAARHGFNPTRIEFGATVERAWQISKDNLGILLGAGLIVLGSSFAIGIIFLIINIAVLGITPGTDGQTGIQVVTSIVQNIISSLVQTFLYLGMTRLTLNLARQQPASIGDLFSAGGLLLPAVVVNFVLGICVFLGMLFCIVPGVWIGLTLCLYWYMLLDQNVGMLDSLKYSARATRGNKLVLLGLWIVSVGLMVIIGLPTCGIGLIFAMPFFVMIFTMAYLGATGQLGPETPAAAPYMTPPPAFE